jgi:hypothetical protein
MSFAGTVNLGVVWLVEVGRMVLLQLCGADLIG